MYWVMGSLSWYCAGVNYLLFFVLFLFLLFSSFLMGASVTLKLVNYCIYSWERISRFQPNGSDFSNNGRAVCFPKGWFRCITLQWHGNQTNAGIKHIVSCVLFIFYTVFFFTLSMVFVSCKWLMPWIVCCHSNWIQFFEINCPSKTIHWMKINCSAE